MTQRFSKMMNSNKRKGRMNNPSSNKLGRSKYFSDKNMACDGIYGNSRVTYTGASLVGCVVQIQVHDGNVYEGVLRTFSHQLDLVLETAHKVSPKSVPVKGVSPTVSNLISSYPFEGGLHDKIVFKLSDVVMMQACNIDLDYAVKDTFTDTAISKFNGQVKERELEPWEGADSDSEETPSSLATLTIEEEDTNGWDANDMFRTNAEKYGVKSSYDNSLQEYTVPLTKKDTEEWKQQEAKALKIAQEIETNTSYQSRIQMENGGDCEEDRFSAVVRSSSTDDTTTTTTSSSKYILPQKRRNAPGIKRHTNTAPSSSPVHLSLKPYSANIPGKGKPFTTPDPPPPAPAPPKGAEKSLEENEEAEPAKLLPPPEQPKVAESVPGPPPKMLPPRIERRRENEKKFAKQKGRMDEIEDFKKFSKNFNVLTEEKECAETEEQALSSQVERMKLEKEEEEEEEEKSANVVKYSTLNPNAKEFVFNPNAKAFTPRSVPAAPPPIPVQATPPPQPPPPPLMAAAPSPQMMAPPQPLFTAMAAPQYVMQAPVSVAISHHQPFVQQHHNSHHHHHHHHPQQRFRKAASAQSILAPTGLPGPSQLTVQYTTSPPGVLHAPAQPQTAVGYPQMNFVVGPRVVSPQPVGVIPTSHSVSYCDASHLPTHLIMSAHPGASHSAASTPHSIHQGAQQQQQQPGHHPPQSQTPVLHPAPSPVHQVPSHSQPPPVYSHHQAMSHHAALAHHHHPGFPPVGPQPVVLMQQPHHHHHAAALHHHMLHQNPGLLPQMALIPTSTAMTSAAPSSVATPPYVQQHP